MALVQFSVKIIDYVNNPNNLLADHPIEIREDTAASPLASIFQDEDGLLPITQPGAITNSIGVFQFYADTSSTIGYISRTAINANIYEEKIRSDERIGDNGVRPTVYPSVDAMKTDPSLGRGLQDSSTQKIDTERYYLGADGGNASYSLKTFARATADGDVYSPTSTVNIQCVNGVAVLQNILITPERVGVNTLDEMQSDLEVELEDVEVPFYGQVKLKNSRGSSSGLIDAPNFAGQTDYGNEPIGFIFHHYTDGNLMQIDNVGEGNDIITLKNARNPNRRPDKASDFVGTGNYVALDRDNAATGFSERLFFVSRLAEMVWTGVAGVAKLWQNKSDDGTPAFRAQTTNQHATVLDVLNGTSNQRQLELKHDVSFTRMLFSGLSPLTSGFGIEASVGDVWVLSQGNSAKRVKINKPIEATSGNTQLTAPSNQMVESFTPLKLRQYSTTTLPSASTFSGGVASISDRAGKPSPLVYSDGTSWYYMDNTLV